MSQQLSFSDDELTAWLDGEAEQSRANLIKDAMERDPVLRAHIENLSIDMDAMKTAFDSLLTKAPKMPVIDAGESVPKPANTWSGWRSATAAIAIIAAGAVGYISANTQDTSWRGYVAAYQALYINETLASIDRADDALDEELSRISNAIAKSIDLSALQAVDALNYKRAQVLGFEGRPLIQLAFLTDQGDPVALCIIRAEDGEAMSTVLKDMEGMSSASWADESFEYLLIGSGDDALIEKAAKAFSSTI